MDFQGLAEEVKSVEKSAGEKKPYAGTVELPKTIDFSPEEFVDKNYQDMLNEYERMEKFAKASGMKFQEFAARLEVPQTAAQKGAPAELKVVEQPKPQAPLKPLAPPVAQKPPAPVALKPSPAPVVLKPSAQPPKAVVLAAPSRPIAQPSQPQPQAQVQPPKQTLPPLKPPVLFPPSISPIPPNVPKKELKEPVQAQLPPPSQKPAREEKEFEFEFAKEKQEQAPAAKEERKAPELSARISELMSAQRSEEKRTAPPAPAPKTEFKPVSKASQISGFEFEKDEMAPARREEEKKPQEEFEPGFTQERAQPAPEMEMELEERRPAPKKEVEISQAAKEAMGESSIIPYLEKHENVSLLVPPLLSATPEEAAEAKYTEIESKVPTTLENTNEAGTKKRMIELTKELFKEKSMNQRQKIKEEIAGLREMLSRKAELPKRAVSYATSFFNTMEVAEKMEISEAKENIMKQYRSQLNKILESFSSSLKIAKKDGERNAIYETFVSDLDALRTQVEQLSDRYESFFLREHTLALQKVRNLASLKSDKYVSEKIDERTKEMKFTYAAEFLSLEDAVRREISSLTKTKRHEALEVRLSAEIEKVLAIVNTPEAELLKYMHGQQEAKYKEFEIGKVNKLELLSQARRLMAKDADLKNDTINKYFGEI